MGAVSVAGELGDPCLVQLKAATDVLFVLAVAGLICTAGAGVVQFGSAVLVPPVRAAGAGRR